MRHVLKVLLFVFFSLFTTHFATGQNAGADSVPSVSGSSKTTPAKPQTLTEKAQYEKKNVTADTGSEESEASLAPVKTHKHQPLILVFFIAFLAGVLAVFTPYVYAFVPITISHLTFQSDTPREGLRNTILFSLFVIAIFSSFGIIASTIDHTTGLRKLSYNWIFNLFFFRLLAGLGLSLLGAFDISLPVAIIRATHNKARSGSIAGLFFMALTLPVVTFSSTGPMVGLVIIQAAKGGITGPIIGMMGFAVGLCLPFNYPRMINIMPISVLNYIKVLLGFIALLLGLKFFSRADIAGEWHLMDRDMFLTIWILLSVIQGAYMMGWLKLSNDYLPAQNIYGQNYVSLLRLFLAIASFTVAIYLLPGIWGAPLRGVSSFLPGY